MSQQVQGTSTPDRATPTAKPEAPAPGAAPQATQATPRAPNASFLATIPNQNAKQALLLAQNGQVPFVRSATQPYFAIDPHNQASYQNSPPVLAVRSPSAAQAQLQQHFLDKKPSPVVSNAAPPGGQRQPIVIAASSPAQQQAALRARNAGASAVRGLNYPVEGQSSTPYAGVPLGQQTQTPPVAVRQGATGGLPNTGAPPNLHALQQQLAITLAASHLSQEQINSLALQLYKQQQQQPAAQQAQAQQPAGQAQPSSAQTQPVQTQAQGAAQGQPAQGQARAPEGQAPFQAGLSRYVPMAQNTPGHLNLGVQSVGTPPRPPPSPHGPEQ